MKKSHKTFILVTMAALTFCGILAAGERGNASQMRGTFIRLVEKQVNEQDHLAIVVKPLNSDDQVTILVPRDNEDLRAAARQLRQGQPVAIAFAGEGPNNWLRRLETGRQPDRGGQSAEGQRRPDDRNVRRDPGQARLSPEARLDRAARNPEQQERLRVRPPQEGARPGPGPEPMEEQIRDIVTRHAEQMSRAFRDVLKTRLAKMEAELRELRGRTEGMERQMQELRAENERLRMQLRNRTEPAVDRRRATREQAEPQRRREGGQPQEGDLQRDPEPARDRAPSPR